MWTFAQSTGNLYNAEGVYVATGYAGGGTDPENLEAVRAKNNPAMQSVHYEGPIPQGMWTILAPVNTITHGPYVMPLMPALDTETFGRDGFLIHGDSVVRPGFASEGCIVLDRATRVKIWESKDHRLNVVDSFEGVQRA